jgi:hypothetical protein
MTHIQFVLLLYGVVCAGTVLSYIIIDQFASAHKHRD